MTPPRAQTTPASARGRGADAVGPGTTAGRFVVRRVLGTDAGGWTEAVGVEAVGVAAGGPAEPVRIALSPPGATDDGALRDLFDRLAALRRLCRTSDLPLVAPLASGRVGSRLYLVRPSVENAMTLAQRLAEGPLAPEATLRLVTQVARGLDALQAFAIPHVPLTPERILLTADVPPQARLHEYGVPRPATCACADPSLLAAVDHLPPEVARGGAVTRAADVYALACVIVHCLTGAPPYPRPRPLLVLDAHGAPPAPQVAAAAGLPAEVDHVLAKALQRVPERRPRTASTLTRSLRRAIAEGGGAARGATTPAAVSAASWPAPAEAQPPGATATDAAPAPAAAPRLPLAPEPVAAAKKTTGDGEVPHAPRAPDPAAAPHAPGAPEPAPVPHGPRTPDPASSRMPAPVGATAARSPVVAASRPRPDATAAAVAQRPAAAPPRAPQPTPARRRGRGVLVAGATLALSAGAGLAASALQPSGSPPATRAVTGGSAAPVVARPLQASTLGPVLRRLDARRRSERRALASAHRAAGQARAARALAAAYAAALADARRSAPAQATVVGPALANAGAAYRRLALAASTGDVHDYRTAAMAVAARERSAAAVLAGRGG